MWQRRPTGTAVERSTWGAVKRRHDAVQALGERVCALRKQNQQLQARLHRAESRHNHNR